MGRFVLSLGLWLALAPFHGAAHAFPLDANWREEDQLEYPLYTDEGRCLLGKTTVMRHETTREWRGLFTPFDNDAIALSGGVTPSTDGEPRKTIKLEPSNAQGTYADFRPRFENGQCVAFTIVLFDEADQEVARHVIDKDRFETLVPESALPSVADCRRGRVARTALGQWTDFACSTDVTEAFQFSPFDASEPIVAVWHERRSPHKDDVQIFFALKTSSGRWAKTRMVNDYQLLWDVLKDEEDRVIAFEVTIRDEAGTPFVRRVYDKSDGRS